jgi:hypothetical protein
MLKAAIAIYAYIVFIIIMIVLLIVFLFKLRKYFINRHGNNSKTIKNKEIDKTRIQDV